jgi:hypothetical protein
MSDKFLLPLPGIFRELYLDTNAWSELAKGNRSTATLDRWLEDNAGFLALSACSASELAQRPDLVESLADFIAQRRVVMLRHGDTELSGKQIFWASYYDFFTPIDLRDEACRAAFVDEFLNGPIVRTYSESHKNREWLEQWIDSARRTSPPPRKRSWEKFPLGLAKWLKARAEAAGFALAEGAIEDPTRYRAAKLQFAYLFQRFYLSGKRFEDSDFIDYLHLQDMAYADAVVTERGIASCLREIARHAPSIVKFEVHDLSWLGPCSSSQGIVSGTCNDIPFDAV